jgi:hypothetical protein
MNIPRLAALLLLVPGCAAAAQHTLVVRVSEGKKTYSHTVRSAAGGQTNFVGKVNGKDMIVNVILAQTGSSFLAQYQLEVSQNGHTFQAQSSPRLSPGDRLTAIDCGDWKVDLALDADLGSGAMPAWKPAGANHRLTAFVGKRICRVVQDVESQSNIVEGSITGGRRSSFILNGVVSAPEGAVCKVQYQIENSPQTPAQGEAALVLGQKTAARGGVSLLVEGPSEAKRAPAAAAAAPAGFTQPSGGVPLLR